MLSSVPGSLSSSKGSFTVFITKASIYQQSELSLLLCLCFLNWLVVLKVVAHMSNLKKNIFNFVCVRTHT